MNTLLTSFRSSVGIGSPVTTSTLCTPSMDKPKSRALVAFRLRSRQVIWGNGSIPISRLILQANRLLSARGRPMGQSAIVTASAPEPRKACTPSQKPALSSSTGGSSSTAMTRLPASNFSQRELDALAAGLSSFFGAETVHLGSGSFKACAVWAICSGVVPQQPPTMEAPA